MVAWSVKASFQIQVEMDFTGGGSNPPWDDDEPEVEGEKRVRVAIWSRKWFGVEAQLNGQCH